MRVLLIVNPFASSVTARNRVVIAKALAADAEVQVVETNRRGHATRFAQDAAKRGVDVVAVLAGDGTLNEAANGLVGTGTALAALPGGSTNVFARTIGLPNDPVDATAALAEALAARSVRRIGVGSANGRVFLFHTGIGFDAALVRQVERRGSLKRWAGHPLFIWAGLTTWFTRYRAHPPRFAITLTNGEVIDDAVFAICLNTNPYTYLGNSPLDLSDQAGLDQPLVMAVFRELGAVRTLWALGNAARGKGLRTSDKVLVEAQQKLMVVTSDAGVPYQADGDDLGDAKRLELRWIPDALDLVVPLEGASG